MIYHIVTGDFAAASLKEAIAMNAEMEGEVIIIKDVLSVGPLQREEGQKFSDLRSSFWQQITQSDKNPVEVDDLERLLQTGNELPKAEQAKIWIWVAPWPADMCTYYWTLHYLGKYIGRVYILNVAGLPFLDEQGKVFFPRSIAEIQPKELVKARRLARPVTPAELEVDGEEWKRLVTENAGIRVLEGGKRLVSKGADYYDSQLTSFASQQYQKASKIVGQSLAKYNIPTGDLYLGWRLRKMAEAGKLTLQGDIAKSLKDFEIRLPSGELEFTNEATAAS